MTLSRAAPDPGAHLDAPSLQRRTPDMAYSAGLFAYRRRSIGGSHDLLMVDYWVE